MPLEDFKMEAPIAGPDTDRRPQESVQPSQRAIPAFLSVAELTQDIN
jgi:hypothetical protein